MTVLLILSAYGLPPDCFDADLAAGRLRAMRQTELARGELAAADGIVTTMHLDQVDFAERQGEIAAFLGRGGRLAFNGHPLRPFVEGIEPYRPLSVSSWHDLALTRLAPHPVFGDIEPATLLKRRGVAGFFGRGHAPLPTGARAITGIGPYRLPVDWEWSPPGGGTIFLHAGNDLWSVAEADINKRLAAQLVAWCEAARERAAA